MEEFTILELNSPSALPVDGVGHVKSPKISDIVNIIGKRMYDSYLSIFIITKASFLESISDYYTEQQLTELDRFPLFQILLVFEDTRAKLIDAINFFFVEDFMFDSENLRLVSIVDKSTIVDDKKSRFVDRISHLSRARDKSGSEIEVVGIIDSDNFGDVRRAILSRNYISTPKNDNGKRRSKKMIEFDRKLEEGRKHSKKKRDEQASMELGNIISKICAWDPGININDLYEYTVYQVYNLFNELNRKIQLDAYISKWSTWGDKDFEFDLWYRTEGTKKSD